jgi:hypothetical protein
MPNLFRRLLERASDTARRSARGTPVPAGIEPPNPDERPKPTARERALMRRRLRALQRRRRALAMKVGEAYAESKRGTINHERLDTRADELEAVEAEARSLAQALDEMQTLDDVVAAGVVARCPACGELVSRRGSYCPSCGSPLGRRGHRVGDGGPPKQLEQPPRVSGAPSPPAPGAPKTAAATGSSTGRPAPRPGR